MIDYKKLVEAGVHFGHKMSRWNPKMEPYIWGYRDGIHLIDVSKTARQLDRAAKFLENVAAEGKTIMWIGTKKAAQGIIKQVGEKLNNPFVTHRWIGGTLTNNPQVKKSFTKLLHLEDVVKKTEHAHYTKKELGVMQKSIDRLNKNIGSIINMSWPVAAIVLVDVKKESTALREAMSMGIPVVALVDTNSDPSAVDYVIPCNDDAPKSISIILDYLAQAVQKGQQASVSKPKEQKKPTVEEIKAAETDVAVLDEEEETTSKKEKAEKPVLKKMKTKEPVKTAKK
ncbi:MAG: 30S ribosomal protein S2 [Candidatus Babeliales bacterium]